MKNFKKILALVVVIVFMVSLIGMLDSTGVDAKTAEKVKIRAVTYFTGADPWTNTWKEVIKDFMKKNPNVEIIDEATPTTNDAIRTKIKTDFASGNEPDVTFFFVGADAEPLLKSGKVFIWDNELKKDTKWSSNIYKSALAFTTYNGPIKEYKGKVYAIPTIGFYEGLYVNVDLFKKYNLPLPTDWNKFIKAVNTFKSKGIIPIAGSILESYYLIETFILSAGGPQGRNTPFHPSWEKGLNIIKDLYKMGAFPKDALTLQDSQAQALFADKKAAMMINGSWCVGGLKDKVNTKIMPVPVVPGGKAHPTDIIGGFGSGWYVSKDLNAKKNGWPVKFVKYITSPEVEAKFIAVGGVPAIKCKVPNVTPVAQSGYDMMAKANSVSMPIDAQILPEAFTKIRTDLAYVVTGKKTAKQLLAEAKKIQDRVKK
ncbi:extracellular solute-binding protein family 1 [Caldicellulosiruptor hydrothermalis 108]|uniref:Extracellular solute-binding protein family 1 n=1 Tax=Caldicellulosiruptor hydrothermalis (strain DSM 18901 / VKM B-2411 / 108) TaxID=632292 RepID=E4Q9G9_CALH1|nr:extracellular solute-binding protein [Caldicellulosiruptor hydrothermalis]ADQ05840.1 extracellular solute-binding protein family 1 [Caldicellulosiruptor hydrothermalis 108]